MSQTMRSPMEEDPKDEQGGTADPAMLLSDWGNGTGMSAAENRASAHTSMWVNAGGSWAAFLLFFWIRFAPVCCRGRDFEVGRAQY
jgi:hypothetical protein